MKKLSLVLIVALVCTCAFCGVKLGASIGRDSIDMGYSKYDMTNSFTLGFDIEYSINDSLSLFADASFIIRAEKSSVVIGPKKPTSASGLIFEAGAFYVLPFDLPVDIEVGAGIKVKHIYFSYTSGGAFGSPSSNPESETMYGGIVNLGLSKAIFDHFEVGLSVSEQISPSLPSINYDDYLSSNTAIKARIKYVF